MINKQTSHPAAPLFSLLQHHYSMLLLLLSSLLLLLQLSLLLMEYYDIPNNADVVKSMKKTYESESYSKYLYPLLTMVDAMRNVKNYYPNGYPHGLSECPYQNQPIVRSSSY